MANLDYRTAEGETKVEELANELFQGFDKVEPHYSEYSFTIIVDNAFEFSFMSIDELMQTKRIIKLLELKRASVLKNGAHAE